MSSPLNKTSRNITQPKSQGASQAMLYATGLREEDMNKAQIGIASVWYEGNSCNMHLNELAALVKEGVVATDLIGTRAARKQISISARPQSIGRTRSASSVSAVVIQSGSSWNNGAASR